ncbi:MAG: hypothetical protein LQ346_002181, partial [Caloplaca aetnensis]
MAQPSLPVFIEYDAIAGSEDYATITIKSAQIHSANIPIPPLTPTTSTTKIPCKVLFRHKVGAYGRHMWRAQFTTDYDPSTDTVDVIKFVSMNQDMREHEDDEGDITERERPLLEAKGVDDNGHQMLRMFVEHEGWEPLRLYAKRSGDWVDDRPMFSQREKEELEAREWVGEEGYSSATEEEEEDNDVAEKVGDKEPGGEG